MYNLEDRKQFKTVGELKELLNTIPNDAAILICGDDYCFMHVEIDKSAVCLDNESLDSAYGLD